MKEIPMLFSTPMVQAILRGDKTQTRRIVKPTKYQTKWLGCNFLSNATKAEITEIEGDLWGKFHNPENGYNTLIRCPYGNVGDSIWVKETFFELNKVHYPDLPHKILDDKVIYYSASFDRSTGALKKKPSLFMPKEASRISLEIENIRIERLNDISEKDAIAEGIEKYDKYGEYGWVDYRDPFQCIYCDTARESYESLWESINGKNSWGINPWVWVIEFKKN